MFTGIITDIGIIRSAEQRGDLRLIVGTAHDPATIAIGASIACSGACLTVIDTGTDSEGHWFAVDASAETLACTAPGMWTVGRRLNLERALKVGDELGGHIVTGHVDGVGTVAHVQESGDSWIITIAAPPAIAPYLAAKGSVTVDGVSLTVNAVADQPDGSTHFVLNIIPHTRAMTTLDEAVPGRAVNLEIDILARYLRRMNDFGKSP